MSSFTAFVSFPSADLTESLIQTALSKLGGSQVIKSLPVPPSLPLLQWSSYDEIDHALCMDNTHDALSSSYVIRKSLIRKHFLHRSLQQFVTKHPNSSLVLAIPLTWDIDLSYADELEEMWSDELYELGCRLPEESPPSGVATQWWILKPGMADRGMGIRLFDSKSSLTAIFEEFERDESDESDAEHEDDGQGVMASHLRHFVIQEYLSNPVLLDPRQVPLVPNGIVPSEGELQGYKFHLRVYCVAQGGLKLYMCRRILALFSSKPYSTPCWPEGEGYSGIDLTAHLTNTSLQEHLGEEGVRLLSELVGCSVLSGDRFTEEDLEDVVEQVGDVLANTFRAALDSSVHFQPIPNAFELFGADLLLTHSSIPNKKYQVQILELNAEPAIHLTGPRLTWVLQELFDDIALHCVGPFFGCKPQPNSDRPSSLKLCLDIQRGGWLGGGMQG